MGGPTVVRPSSALSWFSARLSIQAVLIVSSTGHNSPAGTVQPVREVGRDSRLAEESAAEAGGWQSGMDEEWMTNVYVAGRAGGVGLLAVVSGGHELGSNSGPGAPCSPKGRRTAGTAKCEPTRMRVGPSSMSTSVNKYRASSARSRDLTSSTSVAAFRHITALDVPPEAWRFFTVREPEGEAPHRSARLPPPRAQRARRTVVARRGCSWPVQKAAGHTADPLDGLGHVDGSRRSRPATSHSKSTQASTTGLGTAPGA